MARHSGNGNVRWGVIGLGWFGEIHADTLAQMPGIELAAFCTRRPQRLKDLADQYDVAGRYTDYQELLADPSIDAITITTHIHDHRDIAVAALRAGKHVFLEKPMAPTVEDCEQIIQAAQESDGVFMVGHICRFDPRVALAKQAIDEGRMGRIISMHARRTPTYVAPSPGLDHQRRKCGRMASPTRPEPLCGREGGGPLAHPLRRHGSRGVRCSCQRRGSEPGPSSEPGQGE
jgi:predicted dehydrogenase